MSQPPNNYVCRICNIPGHWIQQCPSKYDPRLSQAPSSYICRICNIPGHWIQNCPNRRQQSQNKTLIDSNSNPPLVTNSNYRFNNLLGINPLFSLGRGQHLLQSQHMINAGDAPKCHQYNNPNVIPQTNQLPDNCRIQISCFNCGIKGHTKLFCPLEHTYNLKSLNEHELRQTGKIWNMDDEDIQKFVNVCMIKQWAEICRTDNLIAKYYEFMGVTGYKDSNYQGKFLRHFRDTGLSPHEIGQKLYDNNYKHIYIGWDDYFPYIMKLNKPDSDTLMYEFIKLCYEDRVPNFINGLYLEQFTKKWIGIVKHESYHINLDDYCVDANGCDLNCRYCANPALYHQYLVPGYIKNDANISLLHIPSDIMQIIILFFDINSDKLSFISSRNDYILSYWKQHFKGDWSPIVATNCINIYEDGSILRHTKSDIILNVEDCDGYNTTKELNVDEINVLKGLLRDYTKDRPCLASTNYEHHTKYSCHRNCSQTHILRCRIGGKMENENAYYVAYNSQNRDDPLWAFVNGLCDKLATHKCLEI